jgi:non-canonical (house-cleaning) NTP pyrophosphatase
MGLRLFSPSGNASSAAKVRATAKRLRNQGMAPQVLRGRAPVDRHRAPFARAEKRSVGRNRAARCLSETQ